MKKTLFAFLLLAVFPGSVTRLAAELAFEQMTIEHEAALLDEKTEALFTFTNAGDAPVTITSLKSSCGCTVPQLEKKTYAPGESGEIQATFTFGSRQGAQHKRITVQTDEPGKPPYLLSLVTRIPEWVEIEPRIIRWKSGDAANPQLIRLRVPNPEVVTIEPPAEAPRHFTLEKEKDSPTERVYRVVPNSTGERSTEFIRFNAVVSENGVTRTRQFGVHCLVR